MEIKRLSVQHLLPASKIFRKLDLQALAPDLAQLDAVKDDSEELARLTVPVLQKILEQAEPVANEIYELLGSLVDPAIPLDQMLEMPLEEFFPLIQQIYQTNQGSLQGFFTSLQRFAPVKSRKR